MKPRLESLKDKARKNWYDRLLAGMVAR